MALDDSRLDIGSRCERKQFRRLHGPFKVADRVAHQQRFLLPEL